MYHDVLDCTRIDKSWKLAQHEGDLRGVLRSHAEAAGHQLSPLSESSAERWPLASHWVALTCTNMHGEACGVDLCHLVHLHVHVTLLLVTPAMTAQVSISQSDNGANDLTTRMKMMWRFQNGREREL